MSPWSNRAYAMNVKSIFALACWVQALRRENARRHKVLELPPSSQSIALILSGYSRNNDEIQRHCKAKPDIS